MSSPPLIGRLPAQEAGSYVTGPSRSQALIQRRQRLIYELRLCNLVNLSWSATQPATAELAVAQPTTVFINRIVRGPELTGLPTLLHMLIYNFLSATKPRAEHVE